MNHEERLAHLELELASLRRLHRRLLAVAGITVVGLAVACTGSSIVESVKELHAQSIVLEDANGKPLARLGAVKGGAELTFTDTKGKRRAVVGYTEEGSHLDLFDADGNRRAIVAAHGDRPGISLTGRNDKPRVALTAEVGGSSLYLFDDNSTPRAIHRVDTQEGPTVNLLDTAGKAVWVAPSIKP